MQLIYAVIVLGSIGAILGLLLGVADQFLQVKEDQRIVEVIELLPGLNCGTCGFPGCAGLAEALINKEAHSMKLCRPSKQAARLAIQAYLASTPGPDGEVIQIEA